MTYQIGTKIKVLRQSKGMTQMDLVESTYSTTYLSRVEQNKIEPSLKFLDYIIPRLGLSKDEFNLTYDEGKIQDIFTRFRNNQKVNDYEFAFLKLGTNLSYTGSTYLKIYSILIRYLVNIKYINEAKVYLLKSKPFLTVTEDNSIRAYYLVSCGNYYYALQDFNKADQLYMQALDYVSPSDPLYADILFNLGLTKQRITDYRLSLSYSEESFNVYTKLNNQLNAHKVLINIGQQLYYLNRYSEAVNKLLAAYNYMVKHNDNLMLSKIEYSLGKVKHKLGKNQESQGHYDNYLNLLKKLGKRENIVYVYRDLAKMYLQTRNLKMVDHYINLFEEISNSYRSYPLIDVEMTYFKSQSFKYKGMEREYENQLNKVYIQSCELKLHQFIQRYGYELAEHYFIKRKFKRSAEIFRESQKKEVII